MGAKSWASPLVTALATLALVVHVAPAAADDYPTRPITILIPLAAGGAMDIIARAMALKLSERLGKRVLVDSGR
jgi:tripartite-type tricarboxylate transporter receptor subunit TctC